jgi:hypothetical protein
VQEFLNLLMWQYVWLAAHTAALETVRPLPIVLCQSFYCFLAILFKRSSAVSAKV